MLSGSPPYTRDTHGALALRNAEVFRCRVPTDFFQHRLVFRHDDAPGITESAFVVLEEQGIPRVPQRQAPEPSDRRVGLEAVAQHALLVAASQLRGQRAVNCYQRFAARRIAGMFDPVVRVAHSFDQRDQDRHVFRPTASHHAVDRNGPNGRGTAVRKQHSKYLVRITVREFEKRFDLFRRRRDDWQAVAPFVLNEKAIDLVDRAGEDDISRCRVLHGFDVVGCFRQVLHDVVERDVVNVFGELRIALRADMARYQSDR